VAVVHQPSDNVIYLFTSVPPTRPNYKRGVLDALCYPGGHQMELSYKKRDISPVVFEKRTDFKGRSGFLVFVDYKHEGDHVFIPIRRIRVENIYPAEEAEQYVDTTRIYVRVELGELILFNGRSNDEIRKLSGRPQKGGSASQYYVLADRDFSPSNDGRSQRDIWDDLVEHVAQAESLKGCVFLATGPVQAFVSESDCEFAPYRGRKKAYSLRPNSTYKLSLRVFDKRHDADSTQEIVVRSSSDLLTISQPFPTAIGGPTDHFALIVCKRTVESTLATLVIDVTSRASADEGSERDGPVPSSGVLCAYEPSAKQEPLSGVICAKPRYLLSISVSQSVLWGFILLVFVGIFLTGASKDFFQDLCFAQPAIWGLLSKLAGAVCLSGAAYLGFRKLPSGAAGA
jgi:hypothetical protein